MRTTSVLLLLAAAASHAQDVGSGAPNDTIRNMFVQAFYRNGFANLVSLPPATDVRRLGSTGYVQEFADLNRTAGVRYALVKPNDSTVQSEGALAVFQLYPGLYAYFTSVGVNNAGFPTTDSRPCPPLANGNSCLYQLFDKPYALFVYANAVNLGANNFSARDPFYTRWAAAGGAGSMGPADTVETAFTTADGVTGTVQTYTSGAVFNITGGTIAARLLTVRPEIYKVFAANGGYTGFLGVPLTEETAVTGGRRRQTFTGGSIDYDPNQSGSGVLRLPVSAIVLAPQQGPIRLNLNDTLTVSALTYAPTGETLTGRDIVWSTSNGRIASIAPNGASVIVKAAGGGAATITATSEGKVSAPLGIFVTAPCCAIGEGAPTTALQQSFQDAITRNRLSPRLPAASPATRIGFGYVQEFADSVSGSPFWIAVSEKTLAGYVIRGAILERYRSLGGSAGSLGYPTTDPTAGGRQNFENGALIGDPVQFVQGAILAKWQSIGYETGVAGPATSDPAAFLTFRATAGRAQSFRNAVIYEILQGAAAQVGKVYYVKGVALAKYAALGFASGALGAPLGDEYMLNGQNRQDFEGGFLEYGQGETEARVTENSRTPVVTATPNSAAAGTVVRLSLGGFANGAQVRVSITGQQDFTVSVPAGAYVWENYLPTSSRSSTVTVRAVDVRTQAAAQAVYNILATAEARIKLAIVRGDQQSGPPGAMLVQPVVVRLADPNGNPVPNVAVRWAASPGAAIVRGDAATDDRGEAQAHFRLANNEGTALGTAEASGQVVTFGARAVRATLTGFPKMTQEAGKGALLVAAASVVRYHQNRGELPSSQGLADPAILDAYLRAFCAFDTSGAQICDGFLDAPGAAPADRIVNLWRLGGFVNNGITVRAEPANDDRIRDLIAAGLAPVVAMRLYAGETPVGSHFAVATGVAGNGAILIQDTAYQRESLADYSIGFTPAGASAALRGELSGVVSIAPRAPASAGFLIAVTGLSKVETPAGECGENFAFTAGAQPYSLNRCDPADAKLLQAFVVRENEAIQGTFTDLANPGNRQEIGGNGSAAFRVARQGAQWGISPLDLAFDPGDVVNAASLTRDLAPGSLAAVFGTGFARNGALDPEVWIDGTPARVVQAFPFQLNFIVPAGAVPGEAMLAVSSDYGYAEHPIVLKVSAPAIVPANGVFNVADGRANSRYNPVTRGQNLQVYVTGLSRDPVAAYVGGIEARVVSTAASALPGISVVTIAIPQALPPSLTAELTLTQGSAISNGVGISVQ
jgi:uncharacterized protein (TIGR03437 family)